MTDDNSTYSLGRSWLSAIVVILAGIATMVAASKISPALTLLIASGTISGEAEGGWPITIVMLVGIVLSIPIGILIDRRGAKELVVIALAIGAVGSITGSFAHSFAFLMLTRVLEGISLGTVTVSGLALITGLFPDEKRGLPMGIWSSFTGLGTLVIFLTSNLFVDATDPSSWSNLWLYTGVLEAVVCVLFALLVKPGHLDDKPAEAAQESKPSLMEGLKSPATWLLAIVVFCLSFGLNIILGFEPAFARNVLGIDYAIANVYTSVFSLAMVIAGLVMGSVFVKVVGLRQRLVVLIVFAVLVLGVFASNFQMGTTLLPAYLFAAGFVMQSLQTTYFNIAPSTARSFATVGTTMGVVSMAMNCSGVSPTIAGAIIERSGYQGVTFMLIGIGVLAVLASVATTRVMLKRKG